MKKKIYTGLIWLFAIALWADGEYSAHKTFKLTRETKVIAITILAEARGEGQGGMYAVAAVIAQRAFERERTPTEICQALPIQLLER